MSDNRYAPPGAPVYDVLPPRQVKSRPREVVLAVQLAVGGYLLGLAVVVMTWDYYSRLQSPSALIWNQALTLIILVWLYSKLYAGRNWARVTLLVLSLFGALFVFNRTFVNIITAAPMLAKINMIISLGLNATVLWLLFISPGREWFKKHPEEPAV
jgi:hypothetical protein